MPNFRPTKSQKIIISFLGTLLILSNFYAVALGFLFVNVGEVQAANPLLEAATAGAGPIPVTDVPGKIDRVVTSIWDTITSVFFKGILQTVTMYSAQVAARYVAAGWKGEQEQFIKDYEEEFENLPSAVAFDALMQVIQGATGIDLCTFDPRMAISIALKIPLFDQPARSYTPSCTWDQYVNHWAEIYQSNLMTFSFDLSVGGTFGANATALQGVCTDRTLYTWDRYFLTFNWIDQGALGCSAGNLLGTSCSMDCYDQAASRCTDQQIIDDTCDSLNECIRSCENEVGNVGLTGYSCAASPVGDSLCQLSNDFQTLTNNLQEDIDKMVLNNNNPSGVNLYAGQTASYGLANTVIGPQNVNLIATKWNQGLDAQLAKLNAIKGLYTPCQSVPARSYAVSPCKSITSEANPPEYGLGVINFPAAPAAGGEVGTTNRPEQQCPEAYERCNNSCIESALDIPECKENCAKGIGPDGNAYTCVAHVSDAAQVFQADLNMKSAYVVNFASTMVSGYETLRTQINEYLKPEFFQGGLPYDYQQAKKFASSEYNDYTAYQKMLHSIGSMEYKELIQRSLQASINQGWRSLMTTVSNTVRAPANMVRTLGEEKLSKSKNAQAWVYTRDLAADALGVFMETLWNEMIPYLLQQLAQEADQAQLDNFNFQTNVDVQPDPLSQFEAFVVTPNATAKNIKQITQRFTPGYTFSDLNLLTDFQTNLSGDLQPNIYNNVVDPNFAQAISNKMTISQALADNKLVGNYTFSWGETADPGTYNLGNIKKLRKARVVPLGLELAVELIRDCAYRKIKGFSDFSDLDDPNGSPYGGFPGAEPYLNQSLKNCLFRPWFSVNNEPASKAIAYNVKKLNEVLNNVTLAQLVENFSKAGTGICGDFDENESAFCNLVNPNWVLKLPSTRCSLPVKSEPYGELIQTAAGQRYSRCPDFVSCLSEDGKGGCINEDYGYCVKEKNTWQFAVDSCPSDFNSCRTYTMRNSLGEGEISYLKNTLSGSEICGSDNAGCTWYTTKAPSENNWKDYVSLLDKTSCESASGLWLNNHCQSARIYLNAFAKPCSKTDEGCNQFMIYRDGATNLVADSGFEYTLVGRFPETWSLSLKREIADPAECTGVGIYDHTCFDYQYVIEAECLANGGTWQNPECLNAINKLATQTDCEDALGTYKQYCLIDTLKKDLCLNGQYSNETTCENYGGEWLGTCEIIPEPNTPITNQNDCEAIAGANWREYCQGAKQYNTNKQNCDALLGDWQGSGPFSDYAQVSLEQTSSGLAKLEINLELVAANESLQLSYLSQFGEEQKRLTKGGDVFTASASLRATRAISSTASLISNVDINSETLGLSQAYSRINTTLITRLPSDLLEIRFDLPGNQPSGTKVFVDDVSLYYQTISQLTNNDLIKPYTDYTENASYYYKKPPARLNCHGYDSQDPSPLFRETDGRLITLQSRCQEVGGYWNQPEVNASGVTLPGVYGSVAACYKYAPDSANCARFMKVCEAEEVGCQLFTPTNNEPAIPGVVAPIDYCPAECVGYDTFTQEPTFFEQEPEPIHMFIPATATACAVSEVGCSQFTDLETEQVQYYTYMRQCIKPGEGAGEKEFFTWQSSPIAAEGIQIVRHNLQSENDGAPSTVDDSGDCAQSLVEQRILDLNLDPTSLDDAELASLRQQVLNENLNCLRFFNDQGEYYRDITKTITASADCIRYRKSKVLAEAQEQTNCQVTNGNWEVDSTGNSACVYQAVPAEAIACSSQVNNCRAYVGNQGNNIYKLIFDTFEASQAAINWYIGQTGTDSTGLTRPAESVYYGGHSLAVPTDIQAIHRPVDIQRGKLYNLSFWAKTVNPVGEAVNVKFSTAVADTDQTTQEQFANNLTLSSTWKYYNLGPIFVSWTNLANNNLVFEFAPGRTAIVYLDNISLSLVYDNVYVVKNSWQTPTSCDRNFFNQPQVGAMIGCQPYTDVLAQTHYLKSFTDSCRSSVVGCQLLIDTQNSVNPNSQTFNEDNISTNDDYVVGGDELASLVLAPKDACAQSFKGCQAMGKPFFEGITTASFEDVYLLNDPDKYLNVAGAILCKEEYLGCVELVNDKGIVEYYKIDPTKLCYFDAQINGWLKKGSNSIGCAVLDYTNQSSCESSGGAWDTLKRLCLPVLQGVNSQNACLDNGGSWQNEICISSPYSIFKVNEANKYRGFVGTCDAKYNGCTEFVDTNPNFLFNGSFETVDLNTLQFLPWQRENVSYGRQDVETNIIKLGNKAIKLTKTSSKEDTGANYRISQKIGRLERGQVYKISFYYKIPTETAAGTGSDNCQLPDAAFSFDPYISSTETQAGQIYKFKPANDWQYVETYYTVPPDGTDRLVDYKLSLYAPLIGNCAQSYIIYDYVEIKDYTEDSYYVIDRGTNLDRNTCTQVDWNAGCVDFFNTDLNQLELIKVKQDRNCEEWAYCAKKDENDNCTIVDLCRQNNAGVCTKLAYQKDKVRYDISGLPIVVKRADYANQTGYIYRFSSRDLSLLNQWRAGDYSGYTLADRYPLEAELDKGFKTYSIINNITVNDQRYTRPICKIYPEQTSPFPYQLAQVAGYRDLNRLYSQSVKLPEIGNGCFYEDPRVSNNGNLNACFPPGKTPNSLCTTPVDKQGASAAINNCESLPVELVKSYTGLEGMCLEFDTLNPISDGIYRDLYGGAGTYQPYACLSYYPFLVDVCALHAPDSNCLANPDCVITNGKCQRAKTNLDLVTTMTVSLPNDQTEIKPGQTLIYEVTIANSGPSNAKSVTVSETALSPAISTQSWTCQAQSGSVCSPNGTGNFSDEVDILSGQKVVYKINALVDTNPTIAVPQSKITKKVELMVPQSIRDEAPGNNTAELITTITAGVADIFVSLSAEPTTAVVGGTVVYTLTVDNKGIGAENVTGVTVTSGIPAGAINNSNCNWTCVGTDGTCTTSGTGQVSDTISLLADGKVVYTITLVVPVIGSPLTVSASATAPANFSDPTTNNEASVNVIIQ